MSRKSQNRRSKRKRRSTLYSNKKPKITGIGYKNKQTALLTLKKLRSENVPLNRQIWIINTLYNRAKYHPSQTDNMIDAMNIYDAWLDRFVGKCS